MKSEHKALVRARAERAIADLYHNATPTYPRETYGRTDKEFNSRFGGAAEFEVEYLADGGSTPGDYRATLAHPANAGRYKSERARAYYIARGMRARDLERADCGMLTGWRVLEWAVLVNGGKVGGPQRAALYVLHRKYPDIKRNDAQWERIGEFGKLYQWGRGGRTLAPDGLVKTGGGSQFSMRKDCEERSIADCIELIRIVESFNAYVAAWCAYVPEMWKDHCADLAREERAERKAARQAKADAAYTALQTRAFC